MKVSFLPPGSRNHNRKLVVWGGGHSISRLELATVMDSSSISNQQCLSTSFVTGHLNIFAIIIMNKC